MATLATNPAALGDYAEIIRDLHDVDKRNQAQRTRRAVVVAVLLTLLGGAALTGRGAQGSGYARGDVAAGDVPSGHVRNGKYDFGDQLPGPYAVLLAHHQVYGR